MRLPELPKLVIAGIAKQKHPSNLEPLTLRQTGMRWDTLGGEGGDLVIGRSGDLAIGKAEPGSTLRQTGMRWDTPGGGIYLVVRHRRGRRCHMGIAETHANL